MSTHHEFPTEFDTDKFTIHRAFLDVYATLFHPHKHRGLPVMELGNQKGGGLIMLADYFRESEVVGFDPTMTPDLSGHEDRITHYEVDAYTERAVRKAKTHGEFAVIVEDGPHSLASQEWCVRHYPHLLARGGVLIIEDVQDIAHGAALSSALPKGFNGVTRDLRHVSNRHDDILFIVSKW